MNAERTEDLRALQARLERATAADAHPPADGGSAVDEEWAELHVLAIELRTALAPEPLSGQLTQRVLARVAEAPASDRRLRPWRATWMSAAAAVLIAVGGPWSLPQPAAAPAAPELTLAEVLELASAVRLLDWDAELEESLAGVSASLDGVRQAVGRPAADESYLPWDAGDDWDVPAEKQSEARPAERSGAPVRIAKILAFACDHGGA